jgi:hypothetical protein
MLGGGLGTEGGAGREILGGGAGSAVVGGGELLGGSVGSGMLGGGARGGRAMGAMLRLGATRCCLCSGSGDGALVGCAGLSLVGDGTGGVEVRRPGRKDGVEAMARTGRFELRRNGAGLVRPCTDWRRIWVVERTGGFALGGDMGE